MDPLRDLDVQRALALSRARESYPSLPREVLLEYCAAAWEVAVRADPGARDLLGTFDRAMLTIAWTRRRSGGRVPLRDLVDQTIPRVALEPFVVAARKAADEEPEPALGARSGDTPPPWRSLLREPFTSPIPVGAAVAAGVVGIALLNEARVLPIAAPQLAGNDEAAPDGAAAPARSEDQGRPAAAPTAGSGGSNLLSSGLVSDELGDAATAQRAAAAREAVRAAAVEGESAASSEPAARGVATGAQAGGAGAESAAAAAVHAAAAPAPQPVVQLQMPEPAIVLEVGAPTTGEDEPSEAGEPIEEAPVTGVIEDAVDQDESGWSDRDRAEDDERPRTGDGPGRHHSRRARAPEEWLDQEEESEDGERRPGDEDSQSRGRSDRDEDKADGGDQDLDESPAPDGGEEAPGGGESVPVGEELPAVSPETAPAPTATTPAPTEATSAPTEAAPAPTEAAPAPTEGAPVPAPAAPAAAPAEQAAPAPAPPTPPAA